MEGVLLGHEGAVALGCHSKKLKAKTSCHPHQGLLPHHGLHIQDKLRSGLECKDY